MAACNTRHDSRQHFCRLGVSRAPNRSSMSLAVNCLTSSTRLAVELLDQHRGRRLADAAAVAVEVDLLERALGRRSAVPCGPRRRTADCRPRARACSADTARDGTDPRSGRGYAPGRVLLRQQAWSKMEKAQATIHPFSVGCGASRGKWLQGTPSVAFRRPGTALRPFPT